MEKQINEVITDKNFKSNKIEPISNKEKQIKEMAFNLIMATSPLGVKDLTKVFDYETVAKDLYELYGWRKETQGEWIETKTGFRCSVCDTHEARKTNYCPNCGAKNAR